MIDNEKSIQAQARLFKALGHPARLIMVKAMMDGKKCVCQFRDVVDCDLSTISRHLTVLREAGVVECEKRGAKIYYALQLDCLDAFFKCAEEAIRLKADEAVETLHGRRNFSW